MSILKNLVPAVVIACSYLAAPAAQPWMQWSLRS